MTKCSYYNRQKIIIKRSLFLTTHFGTGGGRQSSWPPCSPQQPPPPLLINNGIGGGYDILGSQTCLQKNCDICTDKTDTTDNSLLTPLLATLRVPLPPPAPSWAVAQVRFLHGHTPGATPTSPHMHNPLE